MSAGSNLFVNQRLAGRGKNGTRSAKRAGGGWGINHASVADRTSGLPTGQRTPYLRMRGRAPGDMPHPLPVSEAAVSEVSPVSFGPAGSPSPKAARSSCALLRDRVRLHRLTVLPSRE